MKGFSLRQASLRWWMMLLVLGAGSLWLYATPNQGASPLTVIDGPTMGTHYRVVIASPVDDVPGLRSLVEERLNRVVALMSTYEPNSELSNFNASDSTAPMRIAKETREVLEIAKETWLRSAGWFDATVGPLVDLWGFGPDGRPETVPADDALKVTLEHVGSDKFELDGDTVRKTHPKLQIDLSAVAKGYAVDLIAEALNVRGIERYLVEIGGELRVRGEKRPGVPFRIGIERPEVDTRTVHSAFAMRDGALATSGNYRNFYERDGVRYVHTIDPKAGRPVAHHLLSASVYHASCAWADAWATALMASGEHAWTLATENNLEVLLIYAAEDGELEERVTEGLAALRVTH